MQFRFLALLNANHDLKQHDRDEPEDHHVQVKRAARLVHVLRVPRLGLDRLGGPLDLRVDRAEQRLTSFGARTRGRRARVSHQPMRGIRPTLAARRRLAGFAACCAGARGDSRCAGASPCACLWPSRAGGRPRPRWWSGAHLALRASGRFRTLRATRNGWRAKLTSQPFLHLSHPSPLALE